MKRLTMIAAFVLTACKPQEPPALRGVVDAGSTSSTFTDAQADALLGNVCQACHARDLIEQQRITRAQWEGTLKKMKKWGAAIEEAQIPALAANLSTRYGPDKPRWEPPRMAASAAHARLQPLPDVVQGNAAAGHSLFATRCIACHGANAEGGVGVNLVDRPILYRAAEVAATLRSGRGFMPPAPDLVETDVANVLAWLRKLP